jgi:hypothetical protein
MAERKKYYRYILSAIVVVLLTSVAWGAAPHKLNKPSVTSAAIGKKNLKGATGVTIIKGDLSRKGEVLIKGTAEGGGGGVATVEVSLDGGETWRKAQGEESWRYHFKPVPRQSYTLTMRVSNAAGITSDPKAFGIVRLLYLPITLWELIQRQTDELAKAYMSRDLERYMGLISKDYQQYPRGWQRLRRTIHNDFKSLNNIVLHFTVNQVYELEGAIMAEMQWRLTYAGLTKPETGYVEIHFDPSDQLKVILQEKDRYFGAAARKVP